MQNYPTTAVRVRQTVAAKYTMLVSRSGDETKKQIEEAVRQDKIPILLFIEKEDFGGIQ